MLFSTRLKGFSPNRGKRLEGLGVFQGLGALEAWGLGSLGWLGGTSGLRGTGGWGAMGTRVALEHFRT